jgi:hypothetical protein
MRFCFVLIDSLNLYTDEPRFSLPFLCDGDAKSTYSKIEKGEERETGGERQRERARKNYTLKLEQRDAGDCQIKKTYSMKQKRAKNKE